MQILNNKNLSKLPDNVAVPQYSRQQLIPKIVHLGVGNFHRAHQALYTETAINISGQPQSDITDDIQKPAADNAVSLCQSDWGICGISLRRPDMRNKLQAQDNLYTVEVRNNDRRSQQVVGVITEMLVAEEDKGAVISKLASATTQIITLTVTEKAYYLRSDGSLELEHDDIQHDLNNQDNPITVIGYLAAGLRLRRRENNGPVTIICCDNLADNGRKLEAAVKTFLSHSDADSLDWLAAHSAFPNSMVDRIVPGTTDDDIAATTQSLTLRDLAPIATEPFCQWVLEKRFATDIPNWQGAGVQLVADVAPFENIKLRMLNGSHSTLAYLGFLAGYNSVADAMANRDFYHLLERLMRDEIQATLSIPENFDISGYRQQLLDRFANTAMRHQLRQIAMDGSQKLPQRLLPPLQERLERGQSTQCLTLAVAAWIRFSRGINEQGQAFIVDDPIAVKLKALHEKAGPEVDNYLGAIVSESGIFNAELQKNKSLLKQLQHWLSLIEKEGVRAAVASLNLQQ